MSGGLDSTTVLMIAKSMGFEAHAISFDYGQRHEVELQALRKVLQAHGAASHKEVSVDLNTIGGSALTDFEIDVPKRDDIKNHTQGVPVTYVPARNTIFLSIALGYAETIGALDIFLGINAIDYSNYPDCRPDYLTAFENMANLATAAVDTDKRYTFHAPLLKDSKADIIKKGLALGVDYSITQSCYDPNPEGMACGRCDACSLRLVGFHQNGMADPAPYAYRPDMTGC